MTDTREQEWIAAAERYVTAELSADASGHDHWHALRVARTAAKLAALEAADPTVCALAALLHDIADEKLNESEAAGLAKVREWLRAQGIPAGVAEPVLAIIATMSFKGGGGRPMSTPEGRVVQDADRLDALGAVGIARTFAYSGARGQPMHDPDLPPRTTMTREAYRSGKSSAINHFYEKLLKLQGLMNTEAGKREAAERHRFMEEFLRRFFLEWD